MTAPLKMPAPARVPRDLSRLDADMPLPKAQRVEPADDDATQLWKPSDRSGVRWGGGFETTDVVPFPFQGDDEDDSTFISKPNLNDPRLLRSDRPPALASLSPLDLASSPAAVVPSSPEAFAPSVPAAVVPSAPPVPRDLLAEMPSASLPNDWDETPPFVIVAPRRAARPRALFVTAVLLAAAASVVVVVSDPERSAAFVDRVVAGGAALVASLR